jgi:hypothetical protein
MQLTLLIVFLATLGLAWLLSQSRSRAMAVELTDKPFLTDELALRYPKGWDVRQTSDEAPVQILEPKRPGRGHPRLVVLHVMPTTSLTTSQLFQRHVDTKGELGPIGEFPLLGQSGLAAPFDRYEMPSPTEIEVIPTWTAAAVIPGAGRDGSDLGVVLEVRGEAVHGPAGRALLRQVADGLSLRKRPSLPSTAPANER